MPPEPRRPAGTDAPGDDATVLEHLAASLRAKAAHADGEVPPAAILWTDPEAQFAPLIPALRKVLPGLYVLGEYASEALTGPVIWLRCVLAGAVPEAKAHIAETGPDVPPVFYLPGVALGTLRAAPTCPNDLKPLVELRTRGTAWTHPNSRDWTVNAFLSAKRGGLGLDVAGDRATTEALLRNLGTVAAEPVGRLRGRRWDAHALDSLSVPDPVRDLLGWLSDPNVWRRNREGGAWETFREVIRRQFGVDPAEGPDETAVGLRSAKPTFEPVWARFAEAPARYPGVPDRLREATPPANELDLDRGGERDPAGNEEAEAKLGAEWTAALDRPPHDARKAVLKLEKIHGRRRSWVWAALGKSPRAGALERLAALAEGTKTAIGGATLAEAAAAYAATGWRTDAAAIAALAYPAAPAVRAEIAKVVRALYEPWLDDTAKVFQGLAGKDCATLREAADAPAGLPESEPGVCVLFADGLRYDVGAALAAELEGRGLEATLSHRLAPLPSATGTAKPHVSPRRKDFLPPPTPGVDLVPHFRDDGGPQAGKPYTAQGLRDRLTAAGVAVLDAGDAACPPKNAGGWCEAGTLDDKGHKLGADLAGQIKDEVAALADRVESLLGGGWSAVRVVTDHGWLLLPGGLRKAELPPALVAGKGARYAALLGESKSSLPTVPWHWDERARFVTPPGVMALRAAVEYAHGGVSPQECVVPDLVVRGTVANAPAVAIESAEWRGLRCRVTVSTPFPPGATVDLRSNARKAETSLLATGPKPVSDDGTASLLVTDDEQAGSAVTVTLCGPSGDVLARFNTEVPTR